MRVLGFDPSLTDLGWSLYDTEKPPQGSCIARGHFSTGTSLLDIQRYIIQSERVRQLVEQCAPWKIGIESPFFQGESSGHMYALFCFISRVFLEKKQDVVLFAPLQVKKYARQFILRPSKWKMEKVDMVEAARSYTRDPLTSTFERWSEDEADAYWVAHMSARFWQLEQGLIRPSTLSVAEEELFIGEHVFKQGPRKGQTERKGTLNKKWDRYFCWSERTWSYDETIQLALGGVHGEGNEE